MCLLMLLLLHFSFFFL
uniref:Uncharacterized protein n=1 Tax=Rhizophora mucronata TaxID=61149 RepID=A0A2P2NG44_RHIMU